MAEEGKRLHIDYVDHLRFFAMLGVITIHLAGAILNQTVQFGSWDWELLNALTALGSCSVAIFFMLSGYLLLSFESAGDVGVLLKNRLPRLIVPLLAWTVVASVWMGHLADDYSLRGLAERVLKGLYGPVMVHFWFMFTLIALYVISPVLHGGLRALDSRGRRFVLALILLVNLQKVLNCVLPDAVYRYLRFDLLKKLQPFNGALGCFLLGWYLGNLKKRIPNWLLGLAACGILLWITLGTRAFWLQTGYMETEFRHETLGFEVGLAACLFLLCKQGVRRPGRLFQRVPMVPLSYPIYYLHVIVMELLFGLGWTPGSFPASLGFVAVNLLLCYLLVKTAASIRPLCYPATGMSYRRACACCNWQYSFRRRALAAAEPGGAAT